MGYYDPQALMYALLGIPMPEPLLNALNSPVTQAQPYQNTVTPAPSKTGTLSQFGDPANTDIGGQYLPSLRDQPPQSLSAQFAIPSEKSISAGQQAGDDLASAMYNQDPLAMAVYYGVKNDHPEAIAAAEQRYKDKKAELDSKVAAAQLDADSRDKAAETLANSRLQVANANYVKQQLIENGKAAYRQEKTELALTLQKMRSESAKELSNDKIKAVADNIHQKYVNYLSSMKMNEITGDQRITTVDEAKAAMATAAELEKGTQVANQIQNAPDTLKPSVPDFVTNPAAPAGISPARAAELDKGVATAKAWLAGAGHGNIEMLKKGWMDKQLKTDAERKYFLDKLGIKTTP